MKMLNLVLNIIALSYIVAKEMGTIKRYIHNTIDLCNEYIMAFKKQVIVILAKNINAKVIFSDEPFEEDTVVVDLDNDTDMLLATCIAIGEDNTEVVVDYDFRGEDATPLNFSMFGGYSEQHYDLELIKSLGGEKRSVEHYYAFERVIYDLKKQGKVVDAYTLVLNIKLETIKNAIKPIIETEEDWFDERDNTPIINEDSVVIDVALNSYDEVAADIQDTKEPVEEKASTPKDDITLIMEEIEAGVLDKEFLENMLKLNIDSIDKVFYAESK